MHFFFPLKIYNKTCKAFSHTKRKPILYLYNLKLVREDLCFSNVTQNKDRYLILKNLAQTGYKNLEL